MFNSMAQLFKGFRSHAGTVVLNGDHNRIIAIKNMDRRKQLVCPKKSRAEWNFREMAEV